jgi:hypothetical protein
MPIQISAGPQRRQPQETTRAIRFGFHLPAPKINKTFST